jgi:ketosteroid isomerase-like protein
MQQDQRAVLAAAERRAQALAAGDAESLRELLHPHFRWTSFKGEVFDRDSYIASNTAGTLRWREQRLQDVEVMVTGDTATLLALVTDDVERDGANETYQLRLTQVWLRERGRWSCLAGHAGPRLP